jgi:hypothetical protein
LRKCFLAAAGFLPCERNLRLQISDHALVEMLLLRSQISDCALVQMFQNRFYSSWDFYGLGGRGLHLVNRQTRCFLL